MIPIYEFCCAEHGRFEDLVPMDQPTLPCPKCSQPGVKLVSMPAKTATLWNSRWNEGLSNTGFFSYSAGQQVCDKRQEEEIMRKRGFINERDLGGESFYESYTSTKRDEMKQMDATAQTYRDNLKKFDGDKVKAVTETFPAHEMLEQAAVHDAQASNN